MLTPLDLNREVQDTEKVYVNASDELRQAYYSLYYVTYVTNYLNIIIDEVMYYSTRERKGLSEYLRAFDTENNKLLELALDNVIKGIMMPQFQMKDKHLNFEAISKDNARKGLVRVLKFIAKAETVEDTEVGRGVLHTFTEIDADGFIDYLATGDIGTGYWAQPCQLQKQLYYIYEVFNGNTPKDAATYRAPTAMELD